MSKSSKVAELEKEAQKISPDYKIVSYYYFEDKIRTLAGKILTIIDASIPEKQQNKCVKDLIKAEFFRKIEGIQDFYWEGKKGHGVDLETNPKDSLN